MSAIFNDDFRDLIQALNSHDVVHPGRGYAVILHGYRRGIVDFEIWVERTLATCHHKDLDDMEKLTGGA